MDGNGRDWGQIADHISIKMSEALHASAWICLENHMGSKIEFQSFQLSMQMYTCMIYEHTHTEGA